MSIMAWPTIQPITHAQMDRNVEASCSGLAQGGAVAWPENSARAREVAATRADDAATAGEGIRQSAGRREGAGGRHLLGNILDLMRKYRCRGTMGWMRTSLHLSGSWMKE